MSKIASLMARDLVTATASESVVTVAERMARNRVGAVLVVDDQGNLIGLVSERDLLTRVIAEHYDPETTGIGDIKTEHPVTVDVNQSLKEALAIFRQRRFRHLPVTENGKPVGILSTSDLHEFLVEGFERLVDDLKYRNVLSEGEDPYDHFGGQYGR